MNQIINVLMPKQTLPRPTDAELLILRVLWRLGPSTVRQVLDDVGGNTGYTTILKFLQIMTEKGLVQRNESQRTHIYTATLPQEATQRQLITDLLDRAFGGSAKNMVLQALSAKKAPPADLAEIRKMIQQLEKESR